MRRTDRLLSKLRRTGGLLSAELRGAAGLLSAADLLCPCGTKLLRSDCPGHVWYDAGRELPDAPVGPGPGKGCPGPGCPGTAGGSGTGS